MIASAVAKRYAKALFQLALAEKNVEQCSKALSEIAETWNTSAELRQVFENPRFLPEQRRDVIGALADRLMAPKVAKGLVQLLAERGRMPDLRSITDVFELMAEESAGRVRAEIVTATPLPETYYASLQKALSDATGKQVVLVRRQDPSLIGGVVAKVGDTVFDGSIKNRLTGLRHQLLVAASPQGRG